MNLVTLKAGAKHELLFNKPASPVYLFHVYDWMKNTTVTKTGAATFVLATERMSLVQK
jgi:hypothetical protein